MAEDLICTLISNLQVHKKAVNCVAFNPRSGTQQIASGSVDSTVAITNFKELKDIRSYSFSKHEDAITAISFSSSGLLASASLDMTVVLWIPRLTGKSVCFKAHTSPISDVTFSPIGNQLLTGSHDKSLKLWQVRTRQFLLSFIGHNNWVTSVGFNPQNSNIIVSGSDDKTIRLWDSRSNQCDHVYLTPASVTRASYHRNGQTIAVALSNGSVRLYDHRQKKLLQHYDLHDVATNLCWHPFEDYLLTCGSDGNVIIVDVMEGRPLYKLKAHRRPVSSVSFDFSGELFAISSADRRITLWKCQATS